jgi:hypothetical protein
MKRLILVGSAAAVIALMSPAAATIVDVNIAGVVGFGTDPSGVFGAAGASLVGDSFSVAYVFDTSHASTASTNTNVFGGSLYIAPSNLSPVVSSAVTINNITINLPGDELGQMQGLYIGYDTLDYVSDSAIGDINVDIVAPTTSVTTPYSVALSGYNNSGFLSYDGISANLIATAADAEIGGAPLPGAAVLFGSGLLGLGALVRRRAHKGAQPSRIA